jgi:hypothetical protein
MSDMTPRESFLLEMYRQTSSHLNRHILLSWQSIGVVGGALAVFVLGDKSTDLASGKFDFAIAVAILLSAWSVAHVFDANNWFDRNIHIITNIERQFMHRSDLEEIHFYFEAHRKDRSKKALIGHLMIQLRMAIGVWLLLLIYHSYARFGESGNPAPTAFHWTKMIPLAVTIVAALLCRSVYKDRKSDYEMLRFRSPGKRIG